MRFSDRVPTIRAGTQGYRMYFALLVSALLVLACIFIHYEVLRIVAGIIPKLQIPVRFKVLVVVVCCFGAHTVEVWLYALTYAVISGGSEGSLGGHTAGEFSDFVYFSATAYSTIGFGDIYPTGHLRLIAATEGLNGLFLIAWSTSFTYLVMDRMWPLHSEPE